MKETKSLQKVFKKTRYIISKSVTESERKQIVTEKNVTESEKKPLPQGESWWAQRSAQRQSCQPSVGVDFWGTPVDQKCNDSSNYYFAATAKLEFSEQFLMSGRATAKGELPLSSSRRPTRP